MNDMDRKTQIESLVETYYFACDFLRNENIADLKRKALTSFLNSDLSIEEINDEMAKIVEDRHSKYLERYDENAVRENHEEIYSKLRKFVALLNANNVDYQLAGALGGYIKYGEESHRVHDDIDICINEKDIDKLELICREMGLNFKDNRLNTTRVLKNGIPSGEHEIIATTDESDFHIGAFPFEKLKDGTIINKGYYHDEDGNVLVRKETYSRELAEEIYGDSENNVNFEGHNLTITAPEFVYLLKSYTRNDKDLDDIKFLQDKIDMEKVNIIKELSKTDKEITHEVVVSKAKDENDDLEAMFSEENTSNNEEKLTKNNSNSLEKPKTFVKSVQNNEEGFTNQVMLSCCLVLCTCFVCLMVVIFKVL